MSQVNLNATQDSDLDVSASSAVNSSTLSIAEEGRNQKKEKQATESKQKRKCQRATFVIIIGLLIIIMFINGIRSLSEKYSSTKLDHEEEIIPVTKCNQIDNFMTYEPCWEDYTPQREVAKMIDVYRHISSSSGHILKESMNVDGKEFENPLKVLMNETAQNKFFLFRNISGEDGNLYDVYVMPIDDDDAENLKDLKENLEFEERGVDEDEVDDLKVPGFRRTIVHCDDSETCEQTGILEVTEIYTELSESDLKSTHYNEFKREIFLKENKQAISRKFKDCHLDSGYQLIEKLVEL